MHIVQWLECLYIYYVIIEDQCQLKKLVGAFLSEKYVVVAIGAPCGANNPPRFKNNL